MMIGIILNWRTTLGIKSEEIIAGHSLSNLKNLRSLNVFIKVCISKQMRIYDLIKFPIEPVLLLGLNIQEVLSKLSWK
jgi:hypothetical protein